MPKRISEYLIFLSSPSDVRHERESVFDVVERVNNVVAGDDFGVRFDVFSSDDVRPGFSTEPQAVVNEQTPENFDLFIGILWARFGTPTTKFGSGTEEEFRRALSRFEAQGTPEIMFYFKDAPIDMKEIDPEQFKLVKDFTSEFSSLGGFRFEFQSTEMFKDALYKHLIGYARKQKPASTSSTLPSNTYNEEREPLDDLGYLDFIEIFEENISSMTRSLSQIESATTEVGGNFRERSREIDLLATNATLPTKELKKYIRKASVNLVDFSVVVVNRLEEFSQSRDRAFKAFDSMISFSELAKENDSSNFYDLKNEFTASIQATLEARAPVLSLKNTIEGLPRLTSDLNRAKRQASRGLELLIHEMDKTVTLFRNALGYFDQIG